MVAIELSLQFFIVSALMVALVASAEVPEGRTRICEEGEFPGKRVNKRQAEGPNPDAPKPCWLVKLEFELENRV
jgi:hypothetical protein